MTAISIPTSDDGLSRRAFLTGAGAILGSALLLGPNGLPRPGALARLAAANGPRLSLGFVEGSAGVVASEFRSLLTAVGARVTPAASLRSGDRRLAGSLAAVHILGLTNGASVGEAAQLDVLVAPPRGAGSEPLPFYAWTRTARGGGAQTASFVAHVENEPTLGMAFRVGAPGVWRESVAVLTGGRERGLPKLRPGLYLLGLDPALWSHARALPGNDDHAWARLSSVAFAVQAA